MRDWYTGGVTAQGSPPTRVPSPPSWARIWQTGLVSGKRCFVGGGDMHAVAQFNV